MIHLQTIKGPSCPRFSCLSFLIKFLWHQVSSCAWLLCSLYKYTYRQRAGNRILHLFHTAHLYVLTVWCVYFVVICLMLVFSSLPLLFLWFWRGGRAVERDRSPQRRQQPNDFSRKRLLFTIAITGIAVLLGSLLFQKKAEHSQVH